MKFDDLFINIIENLDNSNVKELDKLLTNIDNTAKTLSASLHNVFTLKMPEFGGGNDFSLGVGGIDSEKAESIVNLRRETELLSQVLASTSAAYSDFYASATKSKMKPDEIRSVVTALAEANVALNMSQSQLVDAFTSLGTILAKSKATPKDFASLFKITVPDTEATLAKPFMSLPKKDMNSVALVKEFSNCLEKITSSTIVQTNSRVTSFEQLFKNNTTSDNTFLTNEAKPMNVMHQAVQYEDKWVDFGRELNGFTSTKDSLVSSAINTNNNSQNNSTLNISPGAISITTQAGNAVEIGTSIKDALLEAFQNFNNNQGYNS